jgi:hypothetical protein
MDPDPDRGGIDPRPVTPEGEGLIENVARVISGSIRDAVQEKIQGALNQAGYMGWEVEAFNGGEGAPYSIRVARPIGSTDQKSRHLWIGQNTVSAWILGGPEGAEIRPLNLEEDLICWLVRAVMSGGWKAEIAYQIGIPPTIDYMIDWIESQGWGWEIERTGGTRQHFVIARIVTPRGGFGGQMGETPAEALALALLRAAERTRDLEAQGV